MLLKRIITAVILIPFIIAAIFYMPSLYFSIMVGALILVGAWEWSGLIGFKKNYFRIAYTTCIALALSFLIFTPASTSTLTPTILFIASLIWVWALGAIIHYQRRKSGAGFHFSVIRGIIGFILLLATWAAIITLKTNPHFGPIWLILVFVLIWCVDIGGFFAGRSFGKYALCSRVSPKKTWEGFAGGVILSMIVTAIVGLFLSLSIQRYICLLILALVTALFSVVGDLTVSLLKRISGVKDSGTFFPGHGGMLDRLDSIAAGMMVFVVGAMFLL